MSTSRSLRRGCRARVLIALCASSGAVVRTRLFATFPQPGIRVNDPRDPTTSMHQRYHDGTVQYTMDNLEWVEKREFSKENFGPEQKSNLVQQARARLGRFPRLQAEDLRRVDSGRGLQRFCPWQANGADSFGDPEDNVFVISLARRPEKLQRALQQLQSHGLTATIVTAVDGDAVIYQEDLDALNVKILEGYVGHVNHNMPFTTGEVGCFLSHYSIWLHMIERGIPSALILEDDFDLQEGFTETLGRALAEAKDEDWNLLYIGRSPMENDVRKVSDLVVASTHSCDFQSARHQPSPGDALRWLAFPQRHRHVASRDKVRKGFARDWT